MGELGDFLERAFGAGEPYATVRATIRHWCNKDLEKRAGYSKHAVGRLKSEAQSTTSAANIQEAELSVWAIPPDRYRLEVARAGGGTSSLEVVNENCRWNRDHEGHVEIAEEAKRGRRGHYHCPTDIARHFDNGLLREILSGLALESAGVVQTAARRCARLRAVPRPEGQLWPHWVPSGADEYELHADLERGVLLYIGGRYGGELFEVNEVVRVAFDEPLDEDLFNYTPGYGEQVGPATPVVEHMSLAEAVAKVAFTVFVPTALPPGFREPKVMYHPPRLPAPRAVVALMYSNSESSETLWIQQSGEPDPMIEELEWEVIELAGKRMAISDVPAGESQSIVAFEQAGTHVKIWSSLARGSLLQVAVSLVPAPNPTRN